MSGQPPVLRVNDHFAFIYSVVSSGECGCGSADVVGLSFLDPCDPIAPEIRANVSPNISRVIMRPVRVEVTDAGSRAGSLPAAIFAWECLDVELAVKRGFVKLFAGWNPVKRSEVVGIRREFWLKCKPYFKAKE